MGPFESPAQAMETSPQNNACSDVVTGLGSADIEQKPLREISSHLSVKEIYFYLMTMEMYEQ